MTMSPDFDCLVRVATLHPELHMFAKAPMARARARARARRRPNHGGLTVERSSLKRLQEAPWWARWTNGEASTLMVGTPSTGSSSRYLVLIGFDIYCHCSNHRI